MERSEPRPLFHIVAPEQWTQAQETGLYRSDSLAGEGFVHCSFAEQVAATLGRHYPGVRGLSIVELDPRRIDAPIRVEQIGAASEPFPHVYGPIPVAAAVAVHSADGWVSAPEAPDAAASSDR